MNGKNELSFTDKFFLDYIAFLKELKMKQKNPTISLATLPYMMLIFLTHFVGLDEAEGRATVDVAMQFICQKLEGFLLSRGFCSDNKSNHNLH